MPFVACKHCGQQMNTRRIHGRFRRQWCSDRCRKAAKRAEEKAASGSSG